MANVDATNVHRLRKANRYTPEFDNAFLVLLRFHSS